MAGTQTRVLATRDMIVYNAAYASTNALPADTVLYGTAWGAPYTDLGYTDSGLGISLSSDFADIAVDQEIFPVLKVPTGGTLELQTNLAEFTPANIKTATGQGVITTVAAGVARGHDDLDISGNPVLTYATVGYDMRHIGDSEAFRIIGWRGLPTGQVKSRVQANDKTVIDFTTTLVPDSANANRLLKIRDVIPIV